MFVSDITNIFYKDCYTLIMNKRWFREIGWVYIPINWKGFLITGFIIMFCVNVFLVIDANSHSASDTLFGIFPYVIPALIILYLVAVKTSKKPRK